MSIFYADEARFELATRLENLNNADHVLFINEFPNGYGIDLHERHKNKTVMSIDESRKGKCFSPASLQQGFGLLLGQPFPLDYLLYLISMFFHFFFGS